MPYDELGNYVPGDEAPSVDEMRYELAKRQKEQSVSDLLDKYISDPIRGVSTAGAEVIKRLPGAELARPLAEVAANIGTGLFAPAAAVPASIYKGVKAGEYGKSTNVAGREFEDLMREFTYEPRTQGGRDIMENIAKAIEVSKLPPYIGHIYTPRAPLSANDVRVLAKRGIETGREIAAIPEDFLMAQQGLKRESNLGGTTYGAKLQSVAEDIGDVAARRAARKADEGYVPKPGSVEVFGNLVPETNLYAVKPTGGQLVRAVDPVTGQLREVPDSSVAGISDVYELLRKPTEGQGLVNGYLRNFINRPGIQDVWEDFNAKKVQEEFPKAPTPDQAREAFQVKYPTSKARNERMIQHFDEFAALPEAQAIATQLGITIPTFEDYQKRIDAANTWAQKGFANYIQKYLGTKEDPALQLATQGITFKDPERLAESASDALNYASPEGLRKEREAAGFNAEGEVQPFLKEKLVELKAVDDQLREMVTKRNALYEQARTQNVDPASIPEYAELTNKLSSKIAEKERITQQAENYKLGKSYETLADLAIEKRSPKDLNRKLTFAEKQLFPWLEKTPEDATLYDIEPRLIERIGLTDLATKFMDDIVSGKIPVEQIGNISIPKYIQESAAARMAKEVAAKKDLAAKQKIFDNYLQEQVQSIPRDKIFGNAGVLEITNAMDEDTIRRHLSTDTQVLDHCVGQGGSARESGRQYVPIVDPVTGEVPKGSSGENTGYVRTILKDGDMIASFRDIITGKPVGTVQLNANGSGEFIIGYASGYQNGRMQSAYSDSLANYLNSISDKISGSGDYLTKNGVIDKEHTSRHNMRDVTGLSNRELDQLNFDDMPRFLTRDMVIGLNNERKSMLPSAQLNSEAATLNTSYAELLDENQRLSFDLQNVDDDFAREELMNRRGEIQSQLTDIGQRIGNMPIEEISNVAREMVNDVFPANMTTPRARLQFLDNESPISLRIQPRIFETIREILRDQRDAIGAPLSTTQQLVVNDEWRRISNEIATQQMVGSMYNGSAIANNIRRNPDRYGLADYQDQIIDGVARQVEERGLQDPRNAPLRSIDIFRNDFPRTTVDNLNTLFGNLPRGTTNEAFEQAITELRNRQRVYQNPPEQSFIRDLTDEQRLMAVGEIQDRIRDLEQRIQRQPLVNNARPAEQRQDLAIVADRMLDVIDEDYGAEVGSYVRDLVETIEYNINEDAPLYIESIRRKAEVEMDPEVNTAMNELADRLSEGVRANIAAARNDVAQLPANTVGNVVQNLINQYPEARQVQALIDDLEHGEYGELPVPIREADEIVRDDTVSQIIEQLEEYRDTLPTRTEDRFPEFNGHMNADEARNRIEEILMDDTLDESDIHALRDTINDPDNPQFRSGDMDYINELNDLIDYRLGVDTRVIDEEPVARLPAPEVRPNVRYGTNVRDAFNGIFADNNEFNYLQSLDALRALPQLIRRPGATRNSLGIGAFSNDQANELATHFELLYAQRLREFGIQDRNNPQLPAPAQQVTNSQGVEYTPNYEAVRIYETPRNQTVYHTSDANRPAISTREDRLIPNSLSASHRPDHVWGNTLHRIQIPRGTRVGEVDSIFSILPPDVEDTPRNVGRYLRQYAADQNLDVLKIRGVHGVGIEYAILNPALLPEPEGHKHGGYIQSSKNRLLSPNTDEMRLALLKGK